MSKKQHVHRWILFDTYSYEGIVFVCSGCGARRVIRDLHGTKAAGESEARLDSRRQLFVERTREQG